jgi:hypothetical protein
VQQHVLFEDATLATRAIVFWMAGRDLLRTV